MLLTSVLDVFGWRRRDVVTPGRRDAMTPPSRGCLLLTPVEILIHCVVIRRGREAAVPGNAGPHLGLASAVRIRRVSLFVEDARRETQGKPAPIWVSRSRYAGWADGELFS